MPSPRLGPGLGLRLAWASPLQDRPLWNTVMEAWDDPTFSTVDRYRILACSRVDREKWPGLARSRIDRYKGLGCSRLLQGRRYNGLLQGRPL